MLRVEFRMDLPGETPPYGEIGVPQLRTAPLQGFGGAIGPSAQGRQDVSAADPVGVTVT